MAVKHKLIPPELRVLYKGTAANVYSDIEGDVSQLEGDDGKPIRYSAKAWVEIIRDANRITTWAKQTRERAATHNNFKTVNEWTDFINWLKANEYNEEFNRDMNRAVKEIL